MNTHRVLRIPTMKLVIVALILLAVGGLAILVSIAWPLIHVRVGQSPIQADSLQMVNVFHSAINNDNVDTMLALFTEDATIIDSGSAIQGKGQNRNWEWLSFKKVGSNPSQFIAVYA